MALVLNGDGNVTGLTPGGLPDASITQSDLAAGISGNGPAFSAYKSTTQSISGSTFTKLSFDLEEYDTAGAFDSTTNYRFQPQVAGYYQFNAAFSRNSSSGELLLSIFKNGSEYKRGPDMTGGWTTSVSGMVYMNGTTDYVEVWAYMVTTTSTYGTGSYLNYFQGAMVRAG